MTVLSILKEKLVGSQITVYQFRWTDYFYLNPPPPEYVKDVVEITTTILDVKEVHTYEGTEYLIIFEEGDSVLS